MSTTLQPLIDATAWNLLNRRTPYLARAIYEYLQAGRSPVDVLEEIRTSCTDGSLLPLLACAIHGCASGSTSPSGSENVAGSYNAAFNINAAARRQPTSWLPSAESSESSGGLGFADAAVVLPSLPRGLATEGLEEIRGSMARSRARGRRRRFLVH